MLGNWSFGDYFKKEAIEWAWELVTEVWKFPKNRLYATVYSPDKVKGDPSDFDQEAYDFWAAKFITAGLDSKIHIVYGNKKDNFWMMGDTGPCGPCSEIHVDLTPAGDTKGALVNKGDARCIEIWNLVFIQFNANPDGTFSPLPARHVDTGMGFERVTGIMQNTKSFTDFTRIISNYETDIFRPIFDRIEKLSGKHYKSTLPNSPGSAVVPTAPAPHSEQQIQIDVAFRVIADHIRTLSFSIADGILPGNNDRNYVLRRILRRAVRYGRTLGFHEPFFYKLVEVLAEKMGDVFPELRAKQSHVQEVIKSEEEAFNKTLDKGIELFNGYVEGAERAQEKAMELKLKLQPFRSRVKKLPDVMPGSSISLTRIQNELRDDVLKLVEYSMPMFSREIVVEDAEFRLFQTFVRFSKLVLDADKSEDNYQLFVSSFEGLSLDAESLLVRLSKGLTRISGSIALKRDDPYGFPLDLSELMAPRARPDRGR